MPTDRMALTTPLVDEAERILKPKTFRAVKRHDGFTEEISVVDYWDAVHALAAVMQTAPLTVSTQSEIDALPMYSALMDRDDDVWQKRAEDSWVSYETARSNSARLAKYGPLRVLFPAAAYAPTARQSQDRPAGVEE